MKGMERDGFHAGAMNGVIADSSLLDA